MVILKGLAVLILVIVIMGITKFVLEEAKKIDFSCFKDED